jgi:two-component system, chemotaxis family, protein-glutamate methylesterase/glutaminase
VTAELIVIGTSLGGLSALKQLLAGLPASFSVPVAIVQHRHKDSDELMSGFLQGYLALPLKEVEDKDEIRPGWVYLAPPDYHLLVDRGFFSLSTDPPVSYARPSIDVLFESAADAYADGVIGIILTGANQDGAEGLARVKACGGVAIVQDPRTAESPIMPEAALTSVNRLTETQFALSVSPPVSRTVAVGVDWILPLSEIAPCLVNLCQPSHP